MNKVVQGEEGDMAASLHSIPNTRGKGFETLWTEMLYKLWVAVSLADISGSIILGRGNKKGKGRGGMYLHRVLQREPEVHVTGVEGTREE